MKSTLIRCALAVGLLSTLAVGTAHAQQTFEFKYVRAQPSQTVLVPMPTIGMVPTGTVPLDADVADQLTEAVQQELASTNETRFEIVTQPDGPRVRWAFVARTAPRTSLDALTGKFTEQLITCLHSLEDVNAELAAINLVLTGTIATAEQVGLAVTAAQKALTHWKADRCATQRNALPLWRRNEAETRLAVRGMLTDAFDDEAFNGQPLLDLIRVLTPIFYDDGGFWTSELRPGLEATLAAAADHGLLTTAQTTSIADREQSTFWDWVILAVTTKPGLIRSFNVKAAAGCIATVAGLTERFKLSRCVTGTKLQLVPLLIGGGTYNTVKRVVP